MRYLLVVDWVLAAVGGAMAIGVGFVALVYLIYGSTTPRMAAGLPGVSIVTGCFVVLGVFGLVAGLLLRKGKPMHWLAQLLLFGSLPLLWQTVIFHLRS